MRLDGVRVGGVSGLCFLSPFSPLTETNPLIKLSGIKLKSQLSKRSITILKKKKKGNNKDPTTEQGFSGEKYPGMTLIITLTKTKTQTHTHLTDTYNMEFNISLLSKSNI